jgi:hypothetical protein
MSLGCRSRLGLLDSLCHGRRLGLLCLGLLCLWSARLAGLVFAAAPAAPMPLRLSLAIGWG